MAKLAEIALFQAKPNMSRYLLASILLISLSVLTFVQFRLLLAGVRLEKLRFDQRTEGVLLAVADSLNQPGPRSNALIERLKIGQQQKDTALVHPISDSLDALIKSELRRTGITTSFAFAITPVYNTAVLLANKHYNAEQFRFGEYKMPLGNHIIGNCHFEPVLHFDVPNLFGYLLGELRSLVVPSVLCLLAILLCFLLLLNILRKERLLNTIKNDFINNLTHELKTPAFSISLSSKMAKESLAKDDSRSVSSFLQLIENENNKIKNHVEKVLELASLEDARYHLQKTEAQLHPLIQATAAEFQLAISERGGTLSLRLVASPDTVAVDVEHLKNALRNLLDNSLKYSHGKPEILIATEKKGKNLLISVSDRGMGIDKFHQKKVFDKFFRVPSNDGHLKGFGLGLSYVQQIAKAHGGYVTLESNIGAGSTFTIVLPTGRG